MKIFLVSIFVLGIFLFTSAEMTKAEKDPTQYLEMYKNSDFVVFGEITAIEKKNLSGIEQDFYKIKIKKYLKNPSPLTEIFVVKGTPPTNLPIVVMNNYEVTDTVLLYLINHLDSYVTIQGSQKVAEKIFDFNEIIPRPLKSFKKGIDYTKIVCRDNLILTIKVKDTSPVCVKQNSIDRLEELNVVSKVDIEDMIRKQSQILNTSKITKDVATSMAFGAPLWEKIPGPCQYKLSSCIVSIKLVNGTETDSLPPNLKQLGFWNDRASSELTVDEILKFSEFAFVEKISSGQTLR